MSLRTELWRELKSLLQSDEPCAINAWNNAVTNATCDISLNVITCSCYDCSAKRYSHTW